MSTAAIRVRLLPVLAALAVVPAAAGSPKSAAAVCARVGTNDTLTPIPADLVPAVNAAFGTRMPPDIAVATAVFRCAGGHVLVCTAGANLPCGPANTSRTPGTGAVTWCREHPSDNSIPAVATGHDTVFLWRCQGDQPRVVRRSQATDPRGFIAAYWQRLN